MAAAKSTETRERAREVTIKIPRAAAGESNFVTISLNGKTYQIKRGINVRVPVGVAEIWANSEAAQEVAIAYIDGKKEN